jgi:hypothetical protein
MKGNYGSITTMESEFNILEGKKRIYESGYFPNPYAYMDNTKMFKVIDSRSDPTIVMEVFPKDLGRRHAIKAYFSYIIPGVKFTIDIDDIPEIRERIDMSELLIGEVVTKKNRFSARYQISQASKKELAYIGRELFPYTFVAAAKWMYEENPKTSSQKINVNGVVMTKSAERFYQAVIEDSNKTFINEIRPANISSVFDIYSLATISSIIPPHKIHGKTVDSIVQVSR